MLLPLLAAAMLAVLAVALPLLRRLPQQEYLQLTRAPAWMAVGTGGGLFVLSWLAFSLLGPQGAQVYIGGPRVAMLMIDAYSLWGSALLGAVLAVTAWAPAARRSLLPRALPYFAIVLLLAWCALLMLFSQRLGLTLFSWLLLLAGLMIFCAVLFRPGWRWEQLEIFLIMALSALLGGIGLLWLRMLAQGSEITAMWTVLLSSPPRATNGAVLLIAIGWLSPAVYLPWWAWVRREAEALVWLPGALLLSTVGVLTFIRVIFFIFPAGGGDFSQIPGVEHLFLIKQILNWLLAWGVFALLLGAGWLTYLAIRRRSEMIGVFRPLVLVASGLLLLALAGGVLGLSAPDARRADAITGMLWMLFTWAGVIAVWLTAGNLLPALTTGGERGERVTLYISMWVALAALAAAPPTSGFRALQASWEIWRQSGTPPVLVLLALLATAASCVYLLPRWYRRQAADVTHPGAGWGVIGPFALAFLLLCCGLVAGLFSPIFALVRQSLLQTF